MDYDLVVVGGGIAGSSLARRMALSGARVLLLEREECFHDRIRGEALQPWGVQEARLLGVLDRIQSRAVELAWFEQSINGHPAFRRDLHATTLHGQPMLGFCHPEVQTLLLEDAERAGVEVRRGVTIEQILAGTRPQTIAHQNGATLHPTARMVALCAGRNPALRAELGFIKQRSPMQLLLGGVLLNDLPVAVDRSAAYVSNNVELGTVAALFPQCDGRARAYFGYFPQTCERLQGNADFDRFLAEFRRTAGDAIPLGDAKAAGPLASFECADTWVEHPHRHGVVLVGDAAASNDPSWGQGLSLALRDARLLSDELLARTDWAEAGEAYAGRHDRDYGVVRTVTGWFHELFHNQDHAAQEVRERALPRLGEDPTRAPDHLFSGPDLPLLEDAKARFFAEDVARA